MNNIYQIQGLVESGFDFAQLFPEKQQYIKDTEKFEFKLPEIISFVQQQTNDFKIENPIALDLDRAIVNVITKWSSETGNPNPLTPDITVVDSAPLSEPAQVVTNREITGDHSEWIYAIESFRELLEDRESYSADEIEEWEENIESYNILLAEDGIEFVDGKYQYVNAFAEGGGVNNETILWAVKKGDPDYAEQIITKNPLQFEDAKKWAINNGFDRFRIATINPNEKPDFVNAISKKGFAEGGRVDLFEDYENIPEKVQKILDKYSDEFGGDGSDMDYKDTANMLKEIEAEGYTFGYGLDNAPYGLRPIGVKLNELRDYEDFDDDEYAEGGGVGEKLTKQTIKSKLYKPSGDFFIEDKGDKFILHFTSSDASKNNVSLANMYAENVGKGYYGSAYSVNKNIEHKYAKGGGVDWSLTKNPPKTKYWNLLNKIDDLDHPNLLNDIPAHWLNENKDKIKLLYPKRVSRYLSDGFHEKIQDWDSTQQYAKGGGIYEVQKIGQEDKPLSESMMSAKNLTELKNKVKDKYGTTEGFRVTKRSKSGAFHNVLFQEGGGAGSVTKEEYNNLLSEYDRLTEMYMDFDDDYPVGKVDKVKKAELQKKIQDTESKIHSYEREYKNGGGVGSWIKNKFKRKQKEASPKEYKMIVTRADGTTDDYLFPNSASAEKSKRDMESLGHKATITPVYASGGGVGEYKYKLGDKYRSDFDYDGMLEMGLKSKASWGANKLTKLYNSFVDVNYHSQANILWNAVELIKEGKTDQAENKITELHKSIQDEMNGIEEDANYAGGGKVTSYGLSFSKVDYNVNVNPQSLEVDVNILERDSVDHFALNDTDARWEQHHWGYMIYPKNIDQLYEVLTALKCKVSKNRLKEWSKKGGSAYSNGGNVESNLKKEKGQGYVTADFFEDIKKSIINKFGDKIWRFDEEYSYGLRTGRLFVFTKDGSGYSQIGKYLKDEFGITSKRDIISSGGYRGLAIQGNDYFYNGGGVDDMETFFNDSKNTQGGTSFKEYDAKYSSYKYQAPHVQDALKKAKTFSEFQKLISRFDNGGSVKIGNKYGDWSVTKYTPVIFDELGSQNGGYLKLVNQETFDEIVINNDNALRGSVWFTNSVKGISISDKSLNVVIDKSINGFKTAFSDGGGIKNQYKGEQSSAVWNSWTEDQRRHFLRDHSGEIFLNPKTDTSIGELCQKSFDEVMADKMGLAVKIELDNHVATGQYEKGGEVNTFLSYHTSIPDANKKLVKLRKEGYKCEIRTLGRGHHEIHEIQ